jgi:uncharacterized membrane protein
VTLLTACIFDTADGADDAVRRLMSSARLAQGLVDDAATLRWDDGTARPRIERRVELASMNALGDGFWALVLGLTLRVPLLGAAVGGAAGARSGSLAAAGIDETFMNRLRDLVTPCRSALLAIGPRSASELVGVDLAAPQRPDTVSTEISDRQLAALREAFASQTDGPP